MATKKPNILILWGDEIGICDYVLSVLDLETDSTAPETGAGVAISAPTIAAPAARRRRSGVGRHHAGRG